MPPMITRIDELSQLPWQKELAKVFTSPEQLLIHLGHKPELFAKDIAARSLFPMRVPRAFVALMAKNDIDDPLLRQVLPRAEEFEQVADYVQDPLGEKQAAVKQGEQIIPGLLHKYRSRVLLIVKGGCAVNCRYCFRRHFPYKEHSPSKADWQQAFNYIASQSEVNEVILSGGDPLMASNKELAWFAQQISQLTNIKRLRIHTRLPVVLPHRVDEELMSCFKSLPLQVVMVLHTNHANEMSDGLRLACQQLKQMGVTLLNQSVLLKGVNDNSQALAELSETLFAAGILPYYLHTLDKTAGTAHFDMEQKQAIEIMDELRALLPGFLVPKLVCEQAGESSKTPIY